MTPYEALGLERLVSQKTPHLPTLNSVEKQEHGSLKVDSHQPSGRSIESVIAQGLNELYYPYTETTISLSGISLEQYIKNKNQSTSSQAQTKVLSSIPQEFQATVNELLSLKILCQQLESVKQELDYLLSKHLVRPRSLELRYQLLKQQLPRRTIDALSGLMRIKQVEKVQKLLKELLVCCVQ